jgi:hypothetical protein
LDRELTLLRESDIVGAAMSGMNQGRTEEQREQQGMYSVIEPENVLMTWTIPSIIKLQTNGRKTTTKHGAASGQVRACCS